MLAIRGAGITFLGVNWTHVAEDPMSSTFMIEDSMLDIFVFPYTAHTMLHIREVVIALLARKRVQHCSIAGTAADGESAGQGALKSIDSLKDEVNVCDLHDLQRCALVSSGLDGTPCRNSAGKALLRKHNRLVALTHRNRYVAEGLRQRQREANIPAHRFLCTVKTNKLRWGNQSRQVDQNCVMQPLLDPTLAGLVVHQQATTLRCCGQRRAAGLHCLRL